MNFIYFGTLFVILGFNITLGGTQVELFPDAIGYFLILKGTQDLLDIQPNFRKLQPILYYLLGYNALVFLDKIFNFIPSNGYIYFIFGFVALVLYYIMFYRLFKDFDAFKPLLRKPDEVDRLNRSWKRYTYGGIIFIGLTLLVFIYVVVTLGTGAMEVLYTYTLNYSANLEAIVTELLNSNQTLVYSVFIYLLVAIGIGFTILVYLFKVIYSLYTINRDFRAMKV